VGTGSRLAALVALAVVTSACAGAAARPTASIPPGTLEVRAANLTFAPGQLAVPAEQPFAIAFDNADTVPHNLVIIGPDGTRIFASDVFTGAAQRMLQIPALAPGTYQLHCDVHPEMSGDLVAALSPS